MKFLNKEIEASKYSFLLFLINYLKISNKHKLCIQFIFQDIPIIGYVRCVIRYVTYQEIP